MSVFHVHEWLANELDDDVTVCAVGRLIADRDQIVVGSLGGGIWIVDPGRVNDSKQLLACILQEQLPYALIDIAIANFIATLEQNLLAVLTPRKLIIFRLVTDGEIYRLTILHEHMITAVAYNMCIGAFGRATGMLICVQNLNCSLTVYEAEHQLFHRSVTSSSSDNAAITAAALYPGPITYAPQSDSIILASSSAILYSYKYSILATASSGNYGKKLSADWTFSLGDYPLDLTVIDIAPVQPSIVVLCKRTLLCLTHGGTLRFSLRLQCIAISLLVYNSTPDAYVQLCIATANRMVLFFTDTILIWAAQLSYVPIQIELCTFSSQYRSMLVLLSKSRMSICYLGTEPSLFRLPASQTRFIDFDQRVKEIMEFEAVISKKPVESTEATEKKNTLSLNYSCSSLDTRSQADNSSDDNALLKLNVELSGNQVLDVNLICYTAFHVDQKYFSFPVIDGSENLSLAIYVAEQPVHDLHCRLCAFSSQLGEIITEEFKMPLNLMCRSVTTQRNTEYKVTIESSASVIEMAQLFPEFEAESSIAIRFQPYLSETVISVHASQKSKRYRIQADTLDFLYLFTDELIRRVQAKQPEAKLNCIFPLENIFHKLNNYAELEERKEKEEKELERLCSQMRGIQATILTKLKAERPTEVEHLNSLMEYTHQQMLSCLDRLDQIGTTLRAVGDSLSSALNLLRLMTSLKGTPLPLDGSIINNTEQSVWERIKWIISTVHPIDANADLSPNDLRNIFSNYCQGIGNRMEFIREESEGEEEESSQLEKTVEPLISGSLPFTRTV